jgi:hypothetical protein
VLVFKNAHGRMLGELLGIESRALAFQYHDTFECADVQIPNPSYQAGLDPLMDGDFKRAAAIGVSRSWSAGSSANATAFRAVTDGVAGIARALAGRLWPARRMGCFPRRC